MGSDRVFTDARGLYRAVVSHDSVEVSAWGRGAPLRLTGQVATEVARGLASGAHDAATRARLQTVCPMLAPESQEIVAALLDEPFSSANLAALIRRDGFEMLWIELLSQCNERCLHCYSASGPGEGGQLDPADVRSVLDSAKALGFRRVQFTGGEPLLYEALPGVVEHARQCGLQVEIFTNAVLLDDACLSRLSSGPVDFAVSLYGPTPEVHDAITCVSGSWRKTLDGIARIRAAGFGLRLAVVLMAANRHVAEETVRFARTLCANSHAGAVRQVGRGGFDDQDLRLAAQVNERNVCEGPKPTSVPIRKGKACVDPAGAVLPCIFTRWITLGRLGQEGDLGQILTNPRPRWTAGQVPGQSDGQERFMRELACPECRDAACLLEGWADGRDAV
ncbi:MAG: radical SAM protein [Deltaproteobacteria bacterium]|nr:radical SAM protein [Deltaproteobacteria bacterium]